MYTLRIVIIGNPGNPNHDPANIGAETNILLGKSYKYVNQRRTPEWFNSALQEYKWTGPETIYGIIYDSENKAIALHNDCQHYIMTEGGKTFDRLTQF